MKWTYPILTFFIVTIIGFGLINTLKEDLLVAPNSSGAEEGRLFAHTKNVSRLVSAGPGDLHDYLSEAIPYPEAATASFPPGKETWQDFVLESVKPQPNAKHVILLPGGSDEALRWALPGIYYAFYYGSPVAFFEEGGLRGPAASLTDRKAYLIGPQDLLPSSAGDAFESVARISAATPHELAVELARYRDAETEFGWGKNYDRRNGYFHYVLTTPADALYGLAALPYARSNNATLLYSAEDGGIPAALDAYIWTQRADWMVTPSEGPFRHFWVVSNRLSYAAQGRLDFSVEKADYASMGPIALGPLESLLSIFVFWGIASAIFVWLHGTYFLPMVKMPVKIGWALSSLVLPLLGPILYFKAYRAPSWIDDEGNTRWVRSHSTQSAAATAMGFGYGAPLMIAIGFLMVYFGFPIAFGEWMGGAQSWLGAGMPIMMFVMFFGAVLTAFLLVQYPMKQTMMNMPKNKLAKMAFLTTLLSMAAVSLGMMSGAWFMLMDHIPMMPKDDDLLWFGSMFLVSMLGFLIAWPLNWIMIREELKPGNL